MEATQEDKYRLEQVRGYLNFPIELLRGYNVRMFSRMGDLLAASIIKALDANRLNDEVCFQHILRALGSAFVAVEKISDDADRTPEMTLLLLQWLTWNCPAEWKGRIEATVNKVKEQTKAVDSA